MSQGNLVDFGSDRATRGLGERSNTSFRLRDASTLGTVAPQRPSFPGAGAAMGTGILATQGVQTPAASPKPRPPLRRGACIQGGSRNKHDGLVWHGQRDSLGGPFSASGRSKSSLSHPSGRYIVGVVFAEWVGSKHVSHDEAPRCFVGLTGSGGAPLEPMEHGRSAVVRWVGEDALSSGRVV